MPSPRRASSRGRSRDREHRGKPDKDDKSRREGGDRREKRGRNNESPDRQAKRQKAPAAPAVFAPAVASEEEERRQKLDTKASQREIDALEDRIDRINTVFDLCTVVHDLTPITMTDKRFTPETKASFFMSIVRKATTYYCEPIAEQFLRYIDKYLDTHNIKVLDFVVSKYLETAQLHPTNEAVRQAFRRVVNGRRSNHLQRITPPPLVEEVRQEDVVVALDGPAPARTAVAASAASPPTAVVETATSQRKERSKKKDNSRDLVMEEVKLLMQEIDKRCAGLSVVDEKRKVRQLFEDRGGHKDKEEGDDDDVEVGLPPLDFFTLTGAGSYGYPCVTELPAEPH
eukprot:TRINITY_DN7495_c1_g1_i2.p1 TRINITY_DN7495_c1_g1~~TRINITY_DN7495_c1_g1_i2.p1  ORF type:complete len:343 (+),score=71.55 TRINITY_DN7495_c1_g1_i2:75-1103(+)